MGGQPLRQDFSPELHENERNWTGGTRLISLDIIYKIPNTLSIPTLDLTRQDLIYNQIILLQNDTFHTS